MTKRLLGDLTNKVFYCWRVLKCVGVRQSLNGGLSKTWEVECINCGSKAVKDTCKLKSKRQCKHCLLKPKGESGFNRLLRIYKKVSYNYGREFSLSKEQFKLLVDGNCFYCGQKPSKSIKGNTYTKNNWAEYPYNGIDRKDNDKGYSLDNCISCCFICNRAKNNMKFEDFCEYIKRVAKHNIV
jgi:hypothetical protein